VPETVEKPGPVHAVIENHPGCPPHLPHGVTDSDGHLLACHATKREAQDIALHLDISDATPAPTPGGNTADSPSVSAAAADGLAGLRADLELRLTEGLNSAGLRW
jgi:hypothetical protein